MCSVPSREAGGKYSSYQKCDDDVKTTGTPTYGSLWTCCLSQHRGSKYGLVIDDDFSRFTWVFFLQDKSETQGTLKRFLRRAQNEFELEVKKIRSDNGSEFKNLQVEEYLEEEGIKHEFSAPYTPQQNGVERKNRSLI
jgi:transposase InsO family protein